jgi:hypothetical protein
MRQVEKPELASGLRGHEQAEHEEVTTRSVVRVTQRFALCARK